MAIPSDDDPCITETDELRKMRRHLGPHSVKCYQEIYLDFDTGKWMVATGHDEAPIEVEGPLAGIRYLKRKTLDKAEGIASYYTSEIVKVTKELDKLKKLETDMNQIYCDMLEEVINGDNG